MNWRDISWHYVNLDSRPDRRDHAEQQFARHGIEARRQRGFLPDEWPGDPADVAKMRATTPGAIGCYMGHTNLMRTVVDSDRVVGIFEDDALLCDDFNERMAYIEENLTWDWDILWLGSTYHINPPVWHKETLGRDFELTNPYLC